jgi:hypothetical protein
MKHGRLLWSAQLLFSSREKLGMTSISRKKTFKKGNWALLYDCRFQDFPGKLQTRWLGMYEINGFHDNGTVTLSTINGSGSPFLVNGHRLQLYHQPPSKDSFYQEVSKDPTVQILAGWEGNPATPTP